MPVPQIPTDPQQALLLGNVGRDCGACAMHWWVVYKRMSDTRKRAANWPQQTVQNAGIALESGGRRDRAPQATPYTSLSPPCTGNARVWCLAAKNWLFSRSRNGRAGRGAVVAGVTRPRVEKPMSGCGSGATHASTRGAHPAPCTGQKTGSAEQTLPRISLGPGAQPNTHRDSRGPGQLAGRALRPSTRPPRPQPMRTDGPGRDGLRPISPPFVLITTWLSPRFDSNITFTCNSLEARVQIGQNPRPRTPLKTRCKCQSRS
jgi:hypothetical protein